MALKVRKSDNRPWPVTVSINVCDDAGNVNPVEQTFVAHWKPISEAEHDALLAELAKAFGDPLPGDESAEAEKKPAELTQAQILERNAEYFVRRIDGWGNEVIGEDGQPLPYSKDAIKLLITGEDGKAVNAALVAADWQVRNGIAPRKNASTSHAPGAAAAGNAGEEKTS